MKNTLLYIFVALSLLCLLPSCGDKKENAAKNPSKGVIGITIMSSENPFFNVLANAAKQEAEKHGYTVEILSGDNDPAKQDQQVKDFIVKKVSAIIIAPCNAMSIGASIKEANKADIPVFLADTGCLDPSAKVITTVATKNYEGGKQAGEAMIELLGKSGGEVLILDFKSAESCIKRVKGFKEVIDAFNASNPSTQIKIVAELPGGGSRPKSNQSATDALQAHPNLAAIFAINDPSALGAYSAVQKAGKANKIKIIGFDGMPEGKKAIRDGKIYADPIQFPDKIGAFTVRAIMDYFKGKQVPSEIGIDTRLYRQADALKDPAL